LILSSVVSTQYTSVTDRWTDTASQHTQRYAHASSDKKDTTGTTGTLSVHPFKHSSFSAIHHSLILWLIS